MSSRTVRLAVVEGVTASQPFACGMDHLQAELEWLRLILHREILRLKAANLLSSDPFRGLYLADDQVDAILRDWSAQQQHPPSPVIADVARRAQLVRVEIDERLDESSAVAAATPLMRLATLFDLTAFECKVLVAAIAVEIDLRFETLYSWARNDVTRKSPSVDLVLKLFCEDPDEQLRCRDAFRHDGALFRNQLLRTAEEPNERDASLLSRSVRIDEGIVGFLLEQSGLDHRIAAFTALAAPVRPFSSLHLPESLRVQLRNAALMQDGSVLYLCGPRGAGKRSTVEALCYEAGRQLLTASLTHVAGCNLPPETVLALLQREAKINNADLLIIHGETILVENSAAHPFAAALGHLLPCRGVRIFIASELSWTGPISPAAVWHSFDLPVPSFANRVKMWQQAALTSDVAIASDIDMELLASRFALTGGIIHRAFTEAAQGMKLRGAAGQVLTAQHLEAAARAQSSQGLRRFAQKVDARAGWDSLVLPRHTFRQLRDVCTADRYRQTVYGKWGFDQRLTAGKGLNVLFCGSSGTGKTMAAGVVARELGLDLYRIDLSIVVSKYIGETEKQLSLIFREAKTSNAVIFFDEADALFGKRSEVKDAHDRYANVEIAYLLQKMEEYEGIVILATNLRRNIDDAFTRRIQHVIEFPFPDAEHRERIWKSILPPGAPVANDIDFGFLARQFELAGGNIRNIVLAAAFFAAEEDRPIGMDHCIIATALELQKTGKLPSRAEFRNYYDVIRSRI